MHLMMKCLVYIHMNWNYLMLILVQSVVTLNIVQLMLIMKLKLAWRMIDLMKPMMEMLAQMGVACATALVNRMMRVRMT